jgi:hypothetical protein
MPRARAKSAAKAGGRSVKPRRPAAAIVVSDEERRHLIEDIAYFHAERYRSVEPGECREEDRRRAAAEVDAVLKRRRKP